MPLTDDDDVQLKQRRGSDSKLAGGSPVSGSESLGITFLKANSFSNVADITISNFSSSNKTTDLSNNDGGSNGNFNSFNVLDQFAAVACDADTENLARSKGDQEFGAKSRDELDEMKNLELYRDFINLGISSISFADFVTMKNFLDSQGSSGSNAGVDNSSKGGHHELLTPVQQRGKLNKERNNEVNVENEDDFAGSDYKGKSMSMSISPLGQRKRMVNGNVSGSIVSGINLFANEKENGKETAMEIIKDDAENQASKEHLLEKFGLFGYEGIKRQRDSLNSDHSLNTNSTHELLSPNGCATESLFTANSNMNLTAFEGLKLANLVHSNTTAPQDANGEMQQDSSSMFAQLNASGVQHAVGQTVFPDFSANTKNSGKMSITQENKLNFFGDPAATLKQLQAHASKKSGIDNKVLSNSDAKIAKSGGNKTDINFARMQLQMLVNSPRYGTGQNSNRLEKLKRLPGRPKNENKLHKAISKGKIMSKKMSKSHSKPRLHLKIAKSKEISDQRSRSTDNTMTFEADGEETESGTLSATSKRSALGADMDNESTTSGSSGTSASINGKRQKVGLNEDLPTTGGKTGPRRPRVYRIHKKASERKRRRNEWNDEDIVILLQITRIMIDCELKSISRALFECIKRNPGKSYGRAAEKKLKRMHIFDNWKTCDKSETLEVIEKKLNEFGDLGRIVKPEVEQISNKYKSLEAVIKNSASPTPAAISDNILALAASSTAALSFAPILPSMPVLSGFQAPSESKNFKLLSSLMQPNGPNLFPKSQSFNPKLSLSKQIPLSPKNETASNALAGCNATISESQHLFKKNYTTD